MPDAGLADTTEANRAFMAAIGSAPNVRFQANRPFKQAIKGSSLASTVPQTKASSTVA